MKHRTSLRLEKKGIARLLDAEAYVFTKTGKRVQQSAIIDFLLVNTDLKKVAVHIAEGGADVE